MGIDAGIFQLAGRGVKSIADYDAEASTARQNKLAELMSGAKMDEYQRGVTETNKLNQVYSSALGEDGKVDRNKLISGAASNNLGSKIPGLQKGFLDTDKVQGEVDKQKNDLVDAKLKQSKEFLANISTPEQYIAWHEANHKDPVLGPVLAARGVTADQARGSITAALQQPGGFEKLLQQSAMGLDNFIKFTTPDANARLQAQTSTANNANSVAATDRSTAARLTAATTAAAQKTAPKPMPAAALKMQQEGLDAIGTAKSINADLDAIDTQITGGTLKFGPVGNLANKALNATGMSTEESRNFASFQANMEKLRNDSLRLNKGVQTDGDAQRAWNELFSNINDTKVVQQRLGEIKRLNERAVELRKLDIDNVRSNYGHEPMDTGRYANQPAALNGGKPAPDAPTAPAAPIRIKNAAEYEKIPVGAMFITPDGKMMRKKP